MISQKTERGFIAIFKTLLPYLWPKDRKDLKLRVVFALSFLICAKIVNLYVPFLLKKATDALVLPPPIILPLSLIIGYGVARLSVQLFGELRDYLFAKVTQFTQRRIALKTFEHLHNLSLAFHLDRQTGGLSRTIDRGTKGIQFVLSFLLLNILPTLVEICLVTIVLFLVLDLSFALTTLGTILLYIVYTLLITNWRVRFRKDMNERDNEANTKAIDSLLNYETVKYFNNESHEVHRYDQSLVGYESAALKSQKGLSILNVGQGAIIGLGLCLVMILAGRGVIVGTLSAGDFVMVNTFLIQLYLPLNFLGFVYRETKQGLIDMDQMFSLLEIHTQIQDQPGAPTLVVKKGELVFENVQFAYNVDRPILRNISFRVPAGKKVAIVGPSGSGKSTLLRLLFRFYDVNGGKIQIDGQDLRDVTQNSLRQAIGIVPQDTVLFNDSVAYNIGYGNPKASFEQIVEAAQLARIHDFVSSLPQGYSTLVGERGLKLSGGEKQRVAIARTILKNPSLLIFDEATSALDSHTEKEILASLKEVSRKRTTLVIAHRLSTIVDADEIIVLKHGEIVEQGTHSLLLEKNAEYASMWRRQQETETYAERLEALDLLHR